MFSVFFFSPLVVSIGDMCGYEGYKGSVDGVFTDVSCDSVGGHCDTDNPHVETYDAYYYRIYRCVKSKSNPQHSIFHHHQK